MSVRVMERIWRYGPSDPTDRFVLLCLADKATDDGRNAFPAMATIAERTALSQRTVERTIDRLVTAGYLLRERRYVANGRRNRSNLYTIVLGRLEPNPVMVTVLNDANTVTMTGLDDGNTVTMTPSDTVTMTGSDTVTMTGSDTVTMTPYPSYSDPSYSDPSHSDPSIAAAAAGRRKNGAAAPAAAAADPDSEKREMLARHKLAWNDTTRELADCDWVNDEYIVAHMAAVQRRGEGVGLAITRMLHGEEPPSAKGKDAAAESPATAWQTWQTWQAWQDGDGNGRTSPAVLDATTRQMIDTFGRDELATWDAQMFAEQYQLARQNGRRRIPRELDGVIRR